MESPIIEHKEETLILTHDILGQSAEAQTQPTDPTTEQQQSTETVVAKNSSSESESKTNDSNTQSSEPQTNQEEDSSSNKENMSEDKENSSPKDNLQASLTGDTQIAKLLEKLIKERDRLVELGVLMNQQDKVGGKRQALESTAADSKENVGPSGSIEELPAKKQKTQSEPRVITEQVNGSLKTSNSSEESEQEEKTSSSPKKAVEKKVEPVSDEVEDNEKRQDGQQEESSNQEQEEESSSNEKPQEEEEESAEQEEEEEEDESNVVAEENQPKQQINSLPRTSNLKKLRTMDLKDLIHISKKSVNFGANLPGQISEEPFEIVNKSNENLVVEILIDCINEELQDTDEYVYSIRRSHAYDYNDKHYLIMAPYSSASFRLALKVPGMKFKEQIRGEAKVAIQGLDGNFVIPMSSCVTIPKVFCPRELYNKKYDCNIIKLAMKQGKKLENKVPFKNTGSVPLTIDFEFHKPPTKFNSKFECFIYPTAITVPPGGIAVANVMLKYVGGANPKDTKDLLKRVLIGKVRDSAITYSFYLWIETY